MRIAIVFIVLIAAAQSFSARAEVSAFGYTLGETRVADVADNAQRAGINRYSHGPMFKPATGHFGVDGLEDVTLIFDDENLLSAIMLKMRKSQFATVHGHMRSKYAVREQRIPHVGNRYVRYGAPGATMEINAPHMSFSMSVLYQRDDFVAAYNRISREEERRKNNNARSQF